MITYHGFTKQYGRVVAVAGLDLTVEAGDAVALIGPNGSGKTTTLKAALGLVRPTAGRVLVDGRNVAEDGPAARSRLGYLPQRLSFPDGSTGRDVMRFYARLRGADRAEVERLLGRVGLDSAADRAVDGYSGGMLQRLGLAIALLGGPRALILDEPTAALDPSGALLVRDLLASIRDDGITLFLSSHDLAEVGTVARRVGVFVDGRLAALGSPSDLIRALGLPAYLRVGLLDRAAHAPVAAERAGARAVVWDGSVLHCEIEPGREAAVLDALREAGASVTRISVQIPDLEDIYRAVTAPRPRLVA